MRVPENCTRRAGQSQELPAVRVQSSDVQSDKAVASVLIVDDDRPFRSALRRVLVAAGYSVDDTDTADAALRLVCASALDVVLADLRMPGTDGMDLLRRVRSRDRHLSVVLVTGEPSVASAAEAVEQGAFAYLIKPVDPERLLDIVGRAARMTRMVRLQQLGSEVGRRSLLSRDPVDSSAHARLDRALETLWLAHQPIVDAGTRAVFGYELLLRQQEPSLPHPGAVLEIGDRLDRMRDIGRRVRQVAAACAAALPNDTLVFVNLHTSDLVDPDLVDSRAPLTEFAARTVLEVTERASLQGLPNPVESSGR
jgi:DNA-binding response OmpR family regulator